MVIHHLSIYCTIYLQITKSCANSGNEKLFHNFCCHGIPKSEDNEDWISPIQKAMLVDYEENPTKTMTQKLLQKTLQDAEDREKNFRQIFHPNDLEYCETQSDTYQLLTQKGKKMESIVVLDIFSGIGSGLVALKRLGIAMKTYIHVDNDPVARRVAKYNHDKDGIEFIDSYDSFEELKKNLNGVLERFGPIDLVIGAVPSTKEVDFGSFIAKIQKHRLQKKRNVFYLYETDLRANTSNIQEISKSYETSLEFRPIVIDSKIFSTCSKKRSYWSNLPIENGQVEPYIRGKAFEPTFDDDFELPDKFIGKSTKQPAKAKSLQHLFKFIDDDRMFKVKKVEKDGKVEFEVQTFSVTDREKMLGLKEGFVGNAVSALFENLKEEAFKVEFEGNKMMKASVIAKYSDMLKCKYSFEPGKEDFFKILISPPLSQKPKCLDFEQYGKYLLGKAFCIPVIEFLLSPLQQICERRDYDGFDYDFAWS